MYTNLVMNHEEHVKVYVPKECRILKMIYGHGKNSYRIGITDNPEELSLLITQFLYTPDGLKQKTREEMVSAINAVIPSGRLLDVITQPGFVQVYIGFDHLPVDMLNGIFTDEVMGKIFGAEVIEQDWSTYQIKITFQDLETAQAIQTAIGIGFSKSTEIVTEDGAYALVLQFEDKVFDDFTDSIDQLIVNA